jgi:CheY-like chemotaxis protein
MFDPFSTTKRIGQGTGLHLALVQGIVGDFGGSIDVATQPGAGSTFTVWLPDAGEMPVLGTESAREVPQGHGEAVMIVDDEHALVALAEETLAELGYEPMGFDSSIAALEAFRAEPERFDLVLTDERMPDLVGSELASQIRQLRPEIPIILMSGCDAMQLGECAHDAGITEMIRKPLVRREIAEPLARALQGRGWIANRRWGPAVTTPCVATAALLHVFSNRDGSMSVMRLRSYAWMATIGKTECHQAPGRRFPPGLGYTERPAAYRADRFRP